MKIPATLLLLAIAAATPEPKYFRYLRTIQKPTAAGQTCLVLDPPIFPKVAPQLTDLRLYAGESAANPTETPYILKTLVPTESTPQPIQPLNRGIQKDRGTQQDQTVFDADIPAITGSDGTYSDLVLDIAAQDFIATVTVSGSQSASEQGSGKSTTIGSYTVFDLTKQKLGRSTVLHLPDSNFPYLHFAINGPLSPEQITSLSVSRIPAKEPDYQTIATTTQTTTKSHATQIEFNLPAQTPVDRIVFAPGPTPALFSRDVNITVTPKSSANSGSDNRTLPQPQGFYGTILRVHTLQGTHKIDEERFAVDTPSSFDYPTRWTIEINNGDDQPISLASVRLEMLERSLCFDAAPNLSYTLFYGDPALSAPSYDYARLFTPEPAPAVARLGPEQPNPSYQPRPDERPFTEKHPILLWTALIAVIALLGGIALRSIKAATPAP